MLVLLPAFLILSFPAGAVDIHDTRLLSQPAVGGERIAFIYAENLWTAELSGEGVRQMTTHKGEEFGPCFSPDGSRVAFSAEYDGNADVYIMSAEGGAPQRLTWHPGLDLALGFTPDGAAVLFRSQRETHAGGYWRLYTVPVEGGIPERLAIPHAYKAVYSPGGERMAYTPLGEPFRQWKNYRGGTATRIWIYGFGDHSVREIPRPQGRCNDTDPMWIGEKIYFLSDRSGEFNLFGFDLATGVLEQITFHDDFPILNASSGAGRIIYEQAGYLHLLNPATGEAERLTVGVATDLVATRPRYVSGARYIRRAHISPSGIRAVFGYRGEIVTVPAEKGDPRNLTQTADVHERWPAWSPDGKSIAYFSDASGEYTLHVAAQDGSGEARVYPLDGAGFYDSPRWSPDGKKLSFSDNSWSLYWIDLETGAVRKISSETLYGPVKTLHHAWSPDSRWIVYTRNTATYFQTLQLYSLDEDRSYTVTEGLSDVAEPVFDAGGKYLYMLSSTDVGPIRQWFAMSNTDLRSTSNVYLMVLPEGEPSPLAKESDEEAPADEEETDSGAGPEGSGDAGEGSRDAGVDGEGSDDADSLVVIDFENLSQRIVDLPLESAGYTNLQAGSAGKIYYLKREEGIRTFRRSTPAELCMFDLEEREETTLLENVSEYAVSHDREKFLVRQGDTWLIADAGGAIDPSEGRLDVDAVEIRIEPLREWRQIYDEAWRINRDYFYDPGMHGADWPAIRDKYAVFLDDLTMRSDLNRVLQWMGSELAVGHHYVYGGDELEEVESIPGGLLGADYEIDSGRYRFAKVYGGLNWNPGLRAPLTEPGAGVTAGEYLLAVEGRPLRPPENIYSRFENTAGKIVSITVGPNPDTAGARTVDVVPVEDEYALRNRDWVEGNLRRVNEATQGRVAYVYVPNTAGRGYTYFKRYFFPQAHKEAIIIDERHNGGGRVADYYIDVLRRPLIAYWAMRYGDDLKTPLASIQGPKVMIINETAGSGGDLLPWMFRKLQMGPLVGKRTWGGLVGVLGFPVLLDGGRISAPNLAIWTEDGWVVENEGVPPDIEVEQWPAEVIAGRDPQLEQAIEIVMEQLETDPPAEPERPPYPIRAR
ncbi:MAG: peptidase S41 [Candidatus Eisenbacteria bacterium]|nr:peptidase S41 [Candidatus Eisenbacteria bacterium]